MADRFGPRGSGQQIQTRLQEALGRMNQSPGGWLSQGFGELVPQAPQNHAALLAGQYPPMALIPSNLQGIGIPRAVGMGHNRDLEYMNLIRGGQQQQSVPTPVAQDQGVGMTFPTGDTRFEQESKWARGNAAAAQEMQKIKVRPVSEINPNLTADGMIGRTPYDPNEPHFRFRPWTNTLGDLGTPETMGGMYAFKQNADSMGEFVQNNHRLINGYSTPLQPLPGDAHNRIAAQVTGQKYEAPAPYVPPQPVDSQFAMGGNSMNRLVQLQAQQRAQQAMVPQAPQSGELAPQQFAPYVDRVENYQDGKVAGVEHILPARASRPGPYVGGAEMLRRSTLPLVKNPNTGRYGLARQEQAGGPIDEEVAAEMQAKRQAWQERRDAELARRQESRQDYYRQKYGMRPQAPDAQVAASAASAASDLRPVAQSNTKTEFSPYVIDENQSLPGYSNQESAVLRSAIAGDSEIQSLIDSGQISKRQIRDIVSGLVYRQNSGGLSRSGDERQRQEMEKTVPLAIERLLKFLPKEERESIQKEVDRRISAVNDLSWSL